MLSKAKYSLVKQIAFLQKSNYLVFFVSTRNSNSQFHKFFFEISLLMNRRLNVRTLNTSLLGNIFSDKYSFWLSGHVLCLNLVDLSLDFLKIIKKNNFVLRDYVFIGFKYFSQMYMFDSKQSIEQIFSLDTLSLSLQNYFLYSYLIKNIFNQIFFWYAEILKLIYANIQSTFSWISFR